MTNESKMIKRVLEMFEFHKSGDFKYCDLKNEEMRNFSRITLTPNDERMFISIEYDLDDDILQNVRISNRNEEISYYISIEKISAEENRQIRLWINELQNACIIKEDKVKCDILINLMDESDRYVIAEEGSENESN